MLQSIKYTFPCYIDYVDIAEFSCTRGAKQGWGGKTSYFRAKCVNISKTVGRRRYSKVTIND